MRAKKGNVAGAAAGVTQPAAPGNLSAAAGDEGVTLAWLNPQDATVTGYQVRYAEAGAAQSAWSDIGGSGAATTSHAVTDLTDGTAYTFQVRATAADADGAFAGVTQPDPPGTLTASVGDRTVTLAWDGPGQRPHHRIPIPVPRRRREFRGMDRLYTDRCKRDNRRGKRPDKRRQAYVRGARQCRQRGRGSGQPHHDTGSARSAGRLGGGEGEQVRDADVEGSA